MRRLEMILSRLVWFVPTMAGLVIIVFLISNVIPTDPVKVLLGENATPAQIEAMRVKLGYDQPLWVQLARHFHDIMSGNLGISIYSQRPISEDLCEAPAGHPGTHPGGHHARRSRSAFRSA